MPAILASIQVGVPRLLGDAASADPMDRPWVSGFFKEPVAGPVEVTWSNLAGDAVADRENHGGPDKAILAYSADHFPAWASELRLSALPFGAFGENFSVSNLTEADVCIGDLWKIGPCLFEVSQPRQPCWKLARRWRLKELPALVVATGRTGWYLRIRQAGVVAAGMEPTLEHRPTPDWTIQRTNRVFYHQKTDAVANEKLLAVPTLSMSWKEAIRSRIG